MFLVSSVFILPKYFAKIFCLFFLQIIPKTFESFLIPAIFLIFLKIFCLFILPENSIPVLISFFTFEKGLKMTFFEGRLCSRFWIIGFEGPRAHLGPLEGPFGPSGTEAPFPSLKRGPIWAL
ncbi:hypothetical protein GSUB_16970 (plasmid) [Geoalkalibacter subterraneus]|uniref:Uncharacterized protein n=1 Tax=Geoalkalibacter subterraneus TaxID=483547 RepID=A0A0B5FX57_9BACT|nr:hypothetical protein GSUB_16970 [Geoalkalibacter subterraneus]